MSPAVVVLAGVNGRAGPLCKYAAALTHAHTHALEYVHTKLAHIDTQTPPPPPRVATTKRQEQTSRRVCTEEFKYVDEKTGWCQECPPLLQPVLILVAYMGAIALVLFLLYMLLSKSWRVLKRSAQATRWVTAVHARSFGRQGPAKFRVWPASCRIKISHIEAICYPEVQLSFATMHQQMSPWCRWHWGSIKCCSHLATHLTFPPSLPTT